MPDILPHNLRDKTNIASTKNEIFKSGKQKLLNSMVPVQQYSNQTYASRKNNHFKLRGMSIPKIHINNEKSFIKRINELLNIIIDILKECFGISKDNNSTYEKEESSQPINSKKSSSIYTNTPHSKSSTEKVNQEFNDICEYAADLEPCYNFIEDEFKGEIIDEPKNADKQKFQALPKPTVTDDNSLTGQKEFMKNNDFAQFHQPNELPCFTDSAVKIFDENDESVHPCHANVVHMRSGDIIAAQGPKSSNHIANFFTMVYATDSPVIVDLTNKNDKVKNKRSTQYTPKEGKTIKMGEMEITNRKEIQVMDGKFTLQDIEINDKHCVRIQYNEFNDQTSVNIADLIMLSFMINRLQTKQDKSKNIGPPIMHCSDGVGRTGTATIIFDQVNSYLNHRSKPDPYKAINQFRKARGPMGIQTSDQLATILKTDKNLFQILGPLDQFVL